MLNGSRPVGCLDVRRCLNVWMLGGGSSLEKPSVLLMLHMLRIFKIQAELVINDDQDGLTCQQDGSNDTLLNG